MSNRMKFKKPIFHQIKEKKTGKLVRLMVKYQGRTKKEKLRGTRLAQSEAARRSKHLRDRKPDTRGDIAKTMAMHGCSGFEICNFLNIPMNRRDRNCCYE